MKIEEYKKISEDAEISETFLAGYRKAIAQIKEETVSEKKERRVMKWSSMGFPAKVAVLFCVLLVVGGGSVFSVRAYLSHMEKLRNMRPEEIVELFENVFRYDSGYLSRPLNAAEDSRLANQFLLYQRNEADPEGEVLVISVAKDYSGQGIAFCKEDGILYLPEPELTDEELLQMVEFMLLRQYADYDAYLVANNPLHYLNRYKQMTRSEVDEIYKEFYSACTETSFLSREFSLEELGRKKVLKKLYQKGLKLPEKKIEVIAKIGEASDNTLSFCRENCTYYLPGRELSDEEILEYIDYQLRADYCLDTILEEVKLGIRTEMPELEVIERDRIITLDPELQVEDEVIQQPWLSAYVDVLKKYFEGTKDYGHPENYYANVRFIYLNDDDIPEMLFSHGCTDFDYDDRSNLRVYLYTYQKGKAVAVAPRGATMETFYNYEKPFRYAERKGMVYCDYYYPYTFTSYNQETGCIDSVHDNLSRVDLWDLENLTCKSTTVNIQLLHAKYIPTEEEYDDAEFSYEYYSNVTDIIRDRQKDEVEIKGKKVTQAEYEQAEEELWGGEVYTTLKVTDFDKVYCDDDILEALAKCYLKNK